MLHFRAKQVLFQWFEKLSDLKISRFWINFYWEIFLSSICYNYHLRMYITCLWWYYLILGPKKCFSMFWKIENLNISRFWINFHCEIFLSSICYNYHLRMYITCLWWYYLILGPKKCFSMFWKIENLNISRFWINFLCEIFLTSIFYNCHLGMYFTCFCLCLLISLHFRTKKVLFQWFEKLSDLNISRFWINCHCEIFLPSIFDIYHLPM